MLPHLDNRQESPSALPLKRSEGSIPCFQGKSAFSATIAKAWAGMRLGSKAQRKAKKQNRR
jgi:hypothetical protein